MTRVSQHHFKEDPMKNFAIAIAIAIGIGIGIGILSVQAIADTLQLANGDVLEGEFVGKSNGIIMFNTGSSVEAFPESEVENIQLGSQVETAEKVAEAAPQQKAEATTLTVPNGTRLIIRMRDGIDSRQHKAGYSFQAQLEGAIVVDGVTAAPRGTIVQGRITQASSGGRAVGSSEMAIEFTDILIDDQLYQIATTGLEAKTANEGGKTARRTLGAAALGGLIDGSDGAKTGAKVGLGASILTRGSSINIPAGTILETSLRVPLTLPR